MATGRSNKVVGQIGEFLVCAEVARQCDCIATPFAGNVPVFDVLATDERCRTVPIQVKTVNGGDWQFDATAFLNIKLVESTEIQRIVGLAELDYPDLVCAFVWLGHSKQVEDRFFLFIRSELQAIVHEVYASWLSKHDGHRPRNWQTTHCAVRVSDLLPFENRWELIDEQLHSRARFP